MLDIVYIAGTIAFFGAMLAYVRLCDALGHAGHADADLRQESPRHEAQSQ